MPKITSYPQPNLVTTHTNKLAALHLAYFNATSLTCRCPRHCLSPCCMLGFAPGKKTVTGLKRYRQARSEQQNDNGFSQTLLQRWHSSRDRSGYARLVYHRRKRVFWTRNSCRETMKKLHKNLNQTLLCISGVVIVGKLRNTSTIEDYSFILQRQVIPLWLPAVGKTFIF